MQEKKDFYFPVLLWQTVFSILSVLLIFFASSSQDFKDEFLSFLSSDSQGQEIETALINAKNRFLISETTEETTKENAGTSEKTTEKLESFTFTFSSAEEDETF